jgi:probable HAF family extracellular repeat protein
MKIRVRVCAAGALALAGLASAAAAPVDAASAEFRFRVQCQDCEELQLSGDQNQITALSPRDVMSGQLNGHAAVFRHRHYKDLGTFGGPTSDALDVNASGAVVGQADYPDGSARAFLWQGDQLRDLGVAYPGMDDYSQATGINDQGQIVGVSRTRTESHEYFTHCVVTNVTSGAAMQDLGLPPDAPPKAQCTDPAVNGLGHIAMTIGPEDWSTRWAYLLVNGKWTALGSLDSKDPNSYAEGMNDHDQVVGWSSQHAYLWSDGAMHDLGVLPGGESEGSGAYAINNLGHAVGISGIDPGRKKRFFTAGFIYMKKAMVDLNTLLDFSGSLLWYVADAIDINDRDDIAAYAYHKGLLHYVLLTRIR